MKMVLKDFYNNCIFISIINAIMTLESPDFCSVHSWEGNNYSTNDWEGTRATVSFYKDGCVAACRDDNSNRLNCYKEADCYLKDIPQHVYAIAHSDALQYLLDQVADKVVPLITSAFWVTNDTLHSIDNQTDMMENGMHILYNQLFADTSEILENCIEDYEMTTVQADFAKHLFDLKMESINSPIYMNAKDFPDIFIDLQDCSEGIESFKEIGIIIQ